MSLQAIDDAPCSREPWATSAGGAMRRAAPVVRFVFLGSPYEFGTGTLILGDEDWERIYLCAAPTTSGTFLDVGPVSGVPNTASAILELRRLTGLTWDQLSDLFGVNRRSLHFWASGKPLNAANEEQLRRILNTIRAVDRGSAKANRAILFEEREGRTPFDLLSAGRCDEVVRLLGRGAGRRGIELPPRSAAARETRRPLPPAVLADARQDTVHRDVGRGRAARTKKARRRGRE